MCEYKETVITRVSETTKEALMKLAKEKSKQLGIKVTVSDVVRLILDEKLGADE
ncbi:hypothetical protein [Clostridium fungisolvens]|uniref:Uncharacterized protein n=1 Tax=Clostridium fungisolvens TaxID=1604897 RepID=A0A6V8SMS9_9CLOT|nr:hypothetical protein [Clostridium fungisolvens]GFP78554.1 hypothetical protein bsdtw1_04791 [Clostridium fungisolvens]